MTNHEVTEALYSALKAITPPMPDPKAVAHGRFFIQVKLSDVVAAHKALAAADGRG